MIAWPLAEGRVGYGIYVTVNDSSASSSWGRSHQTVELSFSSIGKCKGDGNTSKYIRINDLSGINIKEDTHTKEGRLKEDSKLSVSSRVNWIYITETAANSSERYLVEINESMPTNLYAVNEVAYRGEGIYKRNSYINNEDNIMTQYNGKKFSESSAFLAVFRNSYITADITPRKVCEFVGENSSTVFRSTADSDQYSGLKWKSSGSNREEDYFGSFKIKTKISKGSSFNYTDDANNYEPLNCCSSGYESLDESLQAAWSCLCRSALSGKV